MIYTRTYEPNPNQRNPYLMRLIEEAVHIRQLHFVVVKQQQLPHPAARQHLGRHAVCRLNGSG